MLRESVTYVIAREETWQGQSATEPVEAGWATEAVFFLRGMGTSKGQLPQVRAQISPDGMRWVDEGTTSILPKDKDDMEFVRVRHFGNWLRLKADLPDGAYCSLLVSVHLK
jgi:hypothetical protein